jgi:tRNA(Ser,Leu) C12 N-acetylase TAN1
MYHTWDMIYYTKFFKSEETKRKIQFGELDVEVITIALIQVL